MISSMIVLFLTRLNVDLISDDSLTTVSSLAHLRGFQYRLYTAPHVMPKPLMIALCSLSPVPLRRQSQNPNSRSNDASPELQKPTIMEKKLSVESHCQFTVSSAVQIRAPLTRINLLPHGTLRLTYKSQSRSPIRLISRPSREQASARRIMGGLSRGVPQSVSSGRRVLVRARAVARAGRRGTVRPGRGCRCRLVLGQGGHVSFC